MSEELGKTRLDIARHYNLNMKRTFDSTSNNETSMPVKTMLPSEIINRNGLMTNTVLCLTLPKDYAREETSCPICLDTLNGTATIMGCLHRFCNECFHRSLRMELGTG